MGKGDRKRRKKKRKKKQNYSPPKKRNEITLEIEKLPAKTKNKDKIVENKIERKTINSDNKKEKKKVNYEIVGEQIKYNENNPVYFLKYATKYNELNGTKVQYMSNFKDVFSFANEGDKTDKKYKNLKNTEFALEWFKHNKFKENNIKYFEIPEKEFEYVRKLNKFSDVNSLIPYSFILYTKIKLTAPYFSKDDDEFYLIKNPCLKEKVFKVPMVRGSGWKGVIEKAGKELINRKLEKLKSNNNPNSDNNCNNDNKNKLSMQDYFQSYLRIFGTGSQEFRNFEKMINECINKSEELSFEKLISFLLFELGLKLERKDISDLKDINKQTEWIREKLWQKFEKGSKNTIPNFLQTHKGRAIFYPTYFDKLSLEIINPHSRKTRAGTNPIHYEAVPKDTKGILQIVYIPFDGVLTKDNDLKEEIKRDIEFLTRAIEIAADIGIGAKEKLGWGRFGLEDTTFYINGKIEGLNLNDKWTECTGDDNE